MNRGFGRVDGGNWGVGGVAGRLCFGVCGKCAKSRAPIACLCKERNGELRTIKSQNPHPVVQNATRVGEPAFSSWLLRNGVNRKANQFGWTTDSTQRGGVAVDGGASGWSRKYWSTGSLRSIKWKPLRVLASTVVCKSSASKGITCSAGFALFSLIIVK